MLTDLEYRVWTQYILSADDFGVMRGTPTPFQNDNDHLANRKHRELQRCIDRLVECGLLCSFEHQGKPYICQHDWQDWQKVAWPSRTFNPPPPADMLEMFTSWTQLLLSVHPGGKKAPRRPESPEELQSTPEELSPSRARERAKRLTANANGSGERLRLHRERFDKFWAAYPHKVGKDAAWQEWLKRSPSDDLTGAMLQAVERDKASPQWRKDGGQFIPHPRTWLHQGRWQDSGLEQPERGSRRCRGDHEPPCSTMQECTQKSLEEARMARAHV